MARPRHAASARPTIRDVAARAAVSTATVSHVVNATGRASAKTREKVLKAIEDLGFRPNGNAASLRNRRSRLVGLVLPTITNSFFAQMASEFEKLANASGYELAMVTTGEDAARERERIEILLSRQLEGLIVYPASDNSVGEGLEARQLPATVLMDRGLALADFDTVGLANESAGYSAARALADLGHRSIAVLLPDLEVAPSRERVDGVMRAMREFGAESRVRVVLGGHSIDGARSAIEQELRREDRVTAIIAATNVATLGAIKAVQSLQLATPGDISLIGWDDLDWMTALRPYVTAFAQPTEQLALHAWQLLLIRIEGKAAARTQHVRVAGELRMRESTGRPKQPQDA